MTVRKVMHFKGQKYSTLRKKALNSGQPFEDDAFPPNSTSLYCQRASASGIVWKRPEELVSNARMCVDDISCRDVVQGELGNCWLVAAVACIAVRKSLWSKVIVDVGEQEWNAKSVHPGIFHFRFWRYGIWVDVVVDSFLPTRHGNLIYMRSPKKNEFWSALLEKAYAKLFGCYESLNGGELAEALEDFTGGVSESCNIVEEKHVADQAKRKEFFKWLLRAADNVDLMCAAIPVKSQKDIEKRNEVGLVMGHAYSVTAVRKVRLAGTGIQGIFQREKLAMIRLRNPWGGTEWTGAFSDRSAEWTRIAKKDRERIGLVFENDGEFWMTFDDFCKFFVNIAICHRVNTAIMTVPKRWIETTLDGSWTWPMRAGGCSNNRATFFNNPQFLFDVSDERDEVMFHLTQKTKRAKGSEKETIGYTIMKVEDNRRYRLHTFQPIIGSSPFRNSRSVFWCRPFARGRYLLVACIFEPSVVGQFMIRVFAGHDIRFRELLKDKPAMPRHCMCCTLRSYPECITRLRIIRATGLKREGRHAGRDVSSYCVISCEGESVRSEVFEKNRGPAYNTTGIFYRKYPERKPVLIKIFHRNTVGVDECLGQFSWFDVVDTGPVVVKLPLNAERRSHDDDNERKTRYMKKAAMTIEVSTGHRLDSL